MPTKRTRVTRDRRVPVPPGVIALLSDAEPQDASEFFTTDPNLRIAWSRTRDTILAGWIEKSPGTRPRYWWECDAPELRRRLGGTGQPAHEVSAHVEVYDHGLPAVWVMPGDDFDGVPVDPADPPRFESEASYLKRLGLFLRGELERLTEDDFAPRIIEADPEAA